MEWYKKRRFGDLAEDAARSFGCQEALVFKHKRYSFGKQMAQINQAAKALIAIGVKKQDHVSLWLNNRDDWMFIAFALAKIGAVTVPINTRLRKDDLKYILHQSDSKFLITHYRSGPINYLEMVNEVVDLPKSSDAIVDPSFPILKHVIIVGNPDTSSALTWSNAKKLGSTVSDKELDKRARSVDPDEPALIMYTSGTTGFPKGVVHSHKLIKNVQDRCFRLAISPTDTILNYLPLFHAFGFSEGALASLITGAKHIITETFDPEECLDLIAAEGVTIIHGFESHLKALAEAQEVNPRDVSSLRTGLFAAGMNSATPILHHGNKTLTPLKSVSGYGMTEIWVGAGIGALDDDLKYRCESSGAVGLGYELQIVNPETNTLQPPGVPGELRVKGHSLMLEYYKKPKETAAAFDEKGWFKTGDTALWMENGYLRFLGRYKDMLKVGGENVDPMEAEGLLLQHPEVHQVAVVGMPDPQLTEIPVAYIQRVPCSEISEYTLVEYCRGRLASFKIPKQVYFVEEFPMTASGKIRKVKLREDAKHRSEG